MLKLCPALVFLPSVPPALFCHSEGLQFYEAPPQNPNKKNPSLYHHTHHLLFPAPAPKLTTIKLQFPSAFSEPLLIDWPNFKKLSRHKELDRSVRSIKAQGSEYQAEFKERSEGGHTCTVTFTTGLMFPFEGETNDD